MIYIKDKENIDQGPDLIIKKKVNIVKDLDLYL